MKIICPSCQTSYDVDNDMNGKKVQCPECGTKWIAADQEIILSLIDKLIIPADDSNMRNAIKLIICERKAGTSFLQRRMGIGYNKANGILDELERRGIVSAPIVEDGQKRNILIFDKENNFDYNYINKISDSIKKLQADVPSSNYCNPPDCSEINAINHTENAVYQEFETSFEESIKKAKKRERVLFVFLIVAIPAAAVFLWFYPPSRKWIDDTIESYKKSKHEAFLRDVDKFENGDPSEVRYFAQQAVEKAVKSPASLRFMRNEMVTRTDKNYEMERIVRRMEKDPKKMWFVCGDFDAQNSFGALIRTRYAAIIECEGNGRYILRKLEFTP